MFHREHILLWFRHSLQSANPLVLLAILIIAGCASVTTQPAVITPISLSTSIESVTLAAGSSIEVTAHASNVVRDSSVTWSIIPHSSQDSICGSLSNITATSATYIAPSKLNVPTLTVSLRARSNEDHSRYCDCSVTVIRAVDSTPPHQTKIAISPVSITLACGQTQYVQAIVTGATNQRVHWRIVPPIGSIALLDSNGNAEYSTPRSISGTSVNTSLEAVADADSQVVARATITIQAPPPTPCFRSAIQPILVSNCSIAGCHNPTDQTAQIDFTTYDGIRATLVPGDTNKGLLFHRLHDVKNPLRPDQIAIIGQWIMAGAPNSQCIEPYTPFDPESIHYSTFVRPTIENYCLGCHSGKNATVSNGYDFSTFDGIQAVALSGRLEGSITYQLFHPRMPQYGAQLDSNTIARVVAWINRGAPND